MSLSNAERQRRYLQNLKSRAADADFADLVRARYRAGAMATLGPGLADTDAAVAHTAQSVVDAIEGHLVSPEDLLQAVEEAGRTWARDQWTRAFQSLQARRPSRRRVTQPSG